MNLFFSISLFLPFSSKMTTLSEKASDKVTFGGWCMSNQSCCPLTNTDNESLAHVRVGNTLAIGYQ